MTTMIFEVFEAFRAAGVPEDKAREAAEALSAENPATKSDINDLKSDVNDLKSDVSDLKSDINDLKAEHRLLRWMIGFNLAFTMAIVWKVFL